MKRIVYFLLFAFFSMTAFSQTGMKVSGLFRNYPPVIGESRTDNFIINPNALPTNDIIRDSLPHYEIGQIPEQTVRYLKEGMGFYVTADSLHSSNVVYNYLVDGQLSGRFYFNANTGRFKFYPDYQDYGTFTVTFTATSGSNSISQDVEFTIMTEVPFEDVAIQSIGEMPSPQVYTIVAESHTEMFFNNAYRTVYSYSISGKEIIFDNHLQNQVWGLSERLDLYELNIFAETLYIRSALRFPHTNVNIYAKKLCFEDNGDEIASINTTPSAITILTNEIGADGESAGNITLNIKDFSANFALRFILNGAQGQCANRNGTPGNGGNGGILTAPISIGNYGDFVRGSAGVKYDIAGRELTEHGPVIGAGQAGENGHFELNNETYSWIHPYYVAAVIRHINDSYLNYYIMYSKATANEYFRAISEFESSDEWEELDATLKVELQDQLLELQGLLYRLNENLDYFGNPLGWVPRLTVEFYMSVYTGEIERAIPTLYLYYWLQHVDQTMENMVEANRVAAEETQREIVATQAQINSLREDIPVLEDRIEVLQSQIETTRIRLEQIQAELLRKAKHNVKKRNRINKAFGVFKAALNFIPVYGPIISTGVGVVGNYFDIGDTYNYEPTLMNTMQSITNVDFGAVLGNMQQAINSIDLNNLGQTGHDLSNVYNQLSSILGPVYNNITSLHQVLAQSSAPNDQVQAEFDRLCSQSPDYQNIKIEIAALEQDYQEFATILTQTFVDIVNLTSEVSNEMVTLDALRRDVFEGNSKRDLQAMQCVEKMRQRAMNRLVKYHYYMRKAYEYRLLRPYQGEFNLENMYDRLEALIDQGQVVFNETTPVSPTAYSALAALFREELSRVVEDVVDELTYHEPEQTATIPIVIPREALDQINANEDYVFNPFEDRYFPSDEENLRIVGVDVQYMEAHMEGNGGMTTYMDIELMHNGISRFRKNGEIYWFNLDSRLGSEPHIWAIRYNPLSQETTSIEPSFAEQSLLYSLLNGNTENMMLFTRRSAWSDIVMSKKVHTTGNADVVIDSLVLRLDYDFTRRPENIRNIDIAASDNLLPYITCSEVDRNGRSNGKGSFHRSFNRSNGTVTFNAPEKHGTYYFVNWTDRQGNVVSENTELTINKQTDQFYRANYERRIPVMNVPDTIFVGCEGGMYTVEVRNVGSGDIEMDWYVSDSLCTYAHLNGISEGIDDGYFTISCEPMGNQGWRIDSIEILAPEIEGMSKMVYIVQYDNSYLEVSASVEPEGAGFIDGTGFYHENDEVTLVALPIDNCNIVSWECNGQVVSTQPEYTFNVTSNTHFVAHFECENMVAVSTEVVPEGAGYITGNGLVNGSGLYAVNDMVTLVAIPMNNCHFVAWKCNGQIVSTSPEYSFVATNDIHLTAHFECDNMITVSTEVVPNGAGNITGMGLVNGSGLYGVNEIVTLIAIPVNNCHFVAWKCNGQIVSTQPEYTFVAKSNIHLTAHFKSENMVALSTEVIPSGSGYIVGNGLVNGSGLYGINDVVTLSAIPINECQFVAWESDGQIVSTLPQCTLVMTKDIHLTARFECEGVVSIRAVVIPENSGFVAGVGTYNIGDVVTLKAYPVIHYTFETWLYNNVSISNSDTYTFIANRDVDYVVKFRDNTGVDEGEQVDVRIYPNPTNGQVYIGCEDMECIHVYSLSGVEEMTKTVKEETTTCIDLSGCSNGLYYLRIITSKGCVVRKVIKL